MKLYLKNRKKEIISRKNGISQIQNNITNYSCALTNPLLDSQTRKETQLVRINVERTKAWALQPKINHRII